MYGKSCIRVCLGVCPVCMCMNVCPRSLSPLPKYFVLLTAS